MKRLFLALLLAVAVGAAPAAHAVPVLQLYIDGGTYDAVNETWVITSNSFDLWVLGNVGQVGSIYDVFLAASVYGASGSISVSVSDPSIPAPPAPVDLGFLTDAQASAMFAGTGFDQGVATHDEYKNATAHRFWSLGDFTLTDSPIGDYGGGVPASFPSTGQINVYRIEISGYDMVHFDAFDHYVNNNKIRYVKAPFSHDAGTTPIPEPGTLALMGTGLAGLALRLRRRRA